MNLSSSSLRYVDLESTNLQGVLTESIFLLPNLETLKLGNNDLLKGVLPKIHPSNTLLELSIAHTGISGELPDSIGTLSSLNILYLRGCQFSGSIPDSIGNLTHITELALSLNHFTGHIPSTIPKLKHLTHLYLSDNSLGGVIPHVFSNLQELVELDLSNNNFHRVHYLHPYVTSRNNFSNSIPNCLGIMANLTMLDIRSNNFSGSLPLLCTQSTSLTTIILNGNQFEGSVPASLLNCVGLEVLDLGNNAINDTFPACLGTLQELQVLILKSNKFHGPINSRKKFCFPRLQIFDLSHNEFSGSLPADFFRNFKAMTKNGTDKSDIR
ncbi:receptor-like protein 37 [Solanum stenotomum]|uniref:receptor-like protein 37 n=1 Tax=Solanum stenotomum TaxID=172797 RepID=UPI0020D0F99F|nr:receptor-like protein 37 [Solanum stenotomum]